ncbi:MAG: 3-oxoacyl-[acyl-carrier-protein] reductase FabG, partial [Planctomycetota bacterium]
MTTDPSSESAPAKPKHSIPLAGRVALVTGGGTGIGAATALCFAEAGAAVAVHFHTSARAAEEVVAKIRAMGGRAMAFTGNLTNSVEASSVVDAAVEHFGRLDILVNNAGSPIARTSLETCSDELWMEALATNLSSAFFVARRAIPHLRQSGNGA